MGGRRRLGIEELAILADVRSALFGRPAEPLRVGRYEVGERIGRGGGGSVYRGRDPTLDRDVAVKFVRHVGGHSPQQTRARVFKEAQALARLSHPNVVEVYDVGEYELDAADDVPQQGVFIAMELLDGQTLGEWLETHHPGVDRILGVFIAAGRGLAAAHDVGLVHRDIKPSNIVLTSDGAVKLLDFGVAGVAQDDDTGSASTSTQTHTPTRSLSGGTPWYMAPEQYGDGTADPFADQYSFCLSLCEALHGRLDVPDLATLQERKLAGDLVPPRRPDVSRALHRTLVRGLAPDPTRRFASMHALLSAVEDPRSGAARFLLPAGAVAVLAVVVGAWATVGESPLTLRGGLASPLPGIPDADLIHAQGLLDAGEIDAAAEVCDAMLDAPSTSDRARALVCRGRVERSRGDFPAAAAALERAFWLASDHGAMDVAAGAAAQSALVAVSAGRIADAHDWVRHGEAAVARASPDVAPIAADLEIAQASAALTQGHHAEALPHYERALEIRTRTWGEESRGAATALKLVANCLQRMERIDEALPKHDLAIERLETALGRDHVDLAAAINDRATSYQSMGRFEDALVDLRRALEMTERLGLSTHPNAGMIRHNMGYSLRRLGRRQEALQQYRRALEIRRAAHGPDHEKTLKTANNLGQVLCELGHVDEGEAVLLDALARYEAQPPHRLQGSVLANLVRVAELRSDAAAAAVYRRRHAALLAEVGEGAER